MKLTELRPCDKCRGPIEKGFYVIEFSQAMVNPRAANEVLGLAQMFGGISGLGIAEAFAPRAEEAVLVFGHRDPTLKTRLIICQRCFLDGPLDLALLWERRIQAAKASEDTTAKENA